MTDTDRTDTNNGTTDPEMVSGTTGMGSDLDASMGGLSGSITPGTLSTADPTMTDELGADSDSVTADIDNDPSSVSGGPDMSGIMGGTGGMSVDDTPVLDSDAMPLPGTTDVDTDATVGRDSDVSIGIGEDAGDLTTGTGTDGGDMLGYGSDAGDPTADAFGGDTDADGGLTAPYGGNTDDPTGSSYQSSDAVTDVNNVDGSGI